MLCHVIFCTCLYQAAFLMLMGLLHARTHARTHYLILFSFNACVSYVTCFSAERKSQFVYFRLLLFYTLMKLQHTIANVRIVMEKGC
jgi:flagellar biosynthesis component FlhA